MLRIVVDAKSVELDENLEKYVSKKVGRLEKYIPRRARESAHIEVRLAQVRAKDKNKSTCELTLHLPHQILNCRETTQHQYAAIDICTAKLREQIAHYKAQYEPLHFRRRLIDEFDGTEEP